MRPVFSQAVQTIRADYDVINHAHLEQLTGLDECLGHLQIFRTGRERASRVVVSNDERVRI